MEDLLDPSFLIDWKLLLADNNRGKRGHPYRTPNAFITFLAKLRAMYSIPFRSPSGVTTLAQNGKNKGKHDQSFMLLYP